MNSSTRTTANQTSEPTLQFERQDALVAAIALGLGAGTLVGGAVGLIVMFWLANAVAGTIAIMSSMAVGSVAGVIVSVARNSLARSST